MHFITPMSEEEIRPHKGKRVCAVMCDGTYHYGTLTDVRDGNLILGGQYNESATVCSAKKTNPKSKANSKTNSKANSKASISLFYPGYGYGYGAGAGVALSLGLLALLFLI